MRWFIEVSRLKEKQAEARYCVLAEQWRAALQRARELRGEEGPLSKFLVELRDDGYRAIDPDRGLRFVVTRAPDDAALSQGGDIAAQADGVRRTTS